MQLFQTPRAGTRAPVCFSYNYSSSAPLTLEIRALSSPRNFAKHHTVLCTRSPKNPDGMHATALRRGCEEEQGDARACAARTDPSQANSKTRMTSIQLKGLNNVVHRSRTCTGRITACTTGDTLRAVFLVALLVAQAEASPPTTPHQSPQSSEPSRDVPCSRRALAASG